MKTQIVSIAMVRTAAAAIRDWIRDTRGAAMVMVAVTLPVLLGMAGLGVDLSGWYAERRITQNMADSAAVAATHAKMAGKTQQEIEAEALAEAQRNGYQAAPGDEIVVTLLGSTPNGAATSEVEVIIRRAAPAFFTSLFINYEPMVAASAKGGIRSNGENCIIGLHEYQPRTVNFMGNTTVVAECGVYSHSEANESLYVGGNATLFANPAQARGDIVASGSGEIYSENGNLMPFQGIQNPDPWASLQIAGDMPTGCTINGLNVGSNQTQSIAPPVANGAVKICGEFTVRGDLDLAPGTYYIYDADITINSQATVTCSICVGSDGVTLVVTGSSASNVGDIRINGGATVELKAPGTGHYAGLLLYKDRIADGSGTNRLNGGSNMFLKGGVYAPTERLDFIGGTDLPGCIQMVALFIDFSGNSYLQNDEAVCADVGLGGSSSTEQLQVVLLP